MTITITTAGSCIVGSSAWAVMRWTPWFLVVVCRPRLKFGRLSVELGLFFFRKRTPIILDTTTAKEI